MTPPAARDSLLRTLDGALRASGAQNTLFTHAIAERLGISTSDLECLDIIQLRGPVTAGELAAATGLTTGAITGLIDRLEKAGFAERERDSEDRRKVLVRLAPRAASRIAPMFGSLQRAMDGLLSSYSQRELELLLDFFKRSHEISVTETAKLRAAAQRTGRRQA
jgi:DNA-binding MarR family transcriptional regulator